MPKDFVDTMKTRWKTLIYSYEIRSEPELTSKLNEIEQSFNEHRKKECKRMRRKDPIEDIDTRPGMEFSNLMIVIDDLHKEVVTSRELARKFQSIRHVATTTTTTATTT